MSYLIRVAFIFVLLFPTFSIAADLQNFTANFLFTDSNGANPIHNRAICKCENIYLKNVSTHGANNTPIGSALNTGVYKVFRRVPYQLIATFTADSWSYGEVKSIQVCQSFTGGGLNLSVQHYGSGISANGERGDNINLSTFKPTVLTTPTPSTQACQGETVQLNATGADSYVWSPSTGLNSNTIPNPTATLMSSQMFAVTGSKTYNLANMWNPSSLTCSSSRSVTINVENIYACDAGRKGMTWQKNSHGDVATVVDVGCGNGADKCDPIQGDTLCTEVRPVLCIHPSNFAKPEGNLGIYQPGWLNEPNKYHKWSGGVIATSPPVSPEAENFDSVTEVNKFCKKTFGEDWRVAEFHDGWGWNFMAYGNPINTSRFWVNINDQINGNCWIN
nr:hypothetical protein BCU62_17675 [Enterovibrio norvegicus]